ncbi:unnamed protein product [Ostreobium quekettii]|uniref:Capsule synthesis protein CapA domain-containing protein n=1 Tax=Ostreobium quekettii TaxID=121088 RepID=A0A8S1IK69_9CHLO|nr:unnamed protein product [Ostreobium quekettii]|eukprot:evm.model.scf_49.5 EVM.evm.TU.scf_49.5   scf_49:48143-53567(-)
MTHSPSAVEGREASIEYVSLANNHILDYGVPGLRESINVLKANGISFSGAGDLLEAQAPAFVQKPGCRLAFFSFSDHYDYWAATDKEPGINFIDPQEYDASQLKILFSHARSNADIIVVFVHWGPNWQWQPSDEIVALGHAFIDNDADVVFGHSAHHVQGVEVYKGHPIMYGAGGFIDDYATDDQYRNDLGFLYRVKIVDNLLDRLELLPSKRTHTWQRPGDDPPYISKVSRAKGKDKDWVCSKMKELSAAFGTKVEDLPNREGLVIALGSS